MTEVEAESRTFSDSALLRAATCECERGKESAVDGGRMFENVADGRMADTCVCVGVCGFSALCVIAGEAQCLRARVGRGHQGESSGRARGHVVVVHARVVLLAHDLVRGERESPKRGQGENTEKCIRSCTK